MNDDTIDKVANALDAYATALHEVQPSPQLDARMQAAIHREMARARSHSNRWQKPIWAVAAGIALIMATATVLTLQRNPEPPLMNVRFEPPPLPGRTIEHGAIAVLPAGGISLWPTEATVFRVQGTFGPAGSPLPAGVVVSPDQEFWIDVRIANDGSMGIERVLSADGSELFARPAIIE